MYLLGDGRELCYRFDFKQCGILLFQQVKKKRKPKKENTQSYKVKETKFWLYKCQSQGRLCVDSCLCSKIYVCCNIKYGHIQSTVPSSPPKRALSMYKLSGVKALKMYICICDPFLGNIHCCLRRGHMGYVNTETGYIKM